MAGTRLSEARVRALVREVLEQELQELLRDVSWRVQQLYPQKLPAEALDLQQHQLTGYTLTDNSPVAGSIAWADLHIVYQGVTYGPYSGNTNLRYVWFDFDHATDKIQKSNTKPTLAKEDALLFINDSGVGTVVPGSSQVHGAAIMGSTIDSAELRDNAVIAAKILDGAVQGAKIATGAVTEAKLGSSAVTADKIGAGAVTEQKLGTGAVTNAKLGDGAVTELKLADSAVTSNKLGSGAVTTGKIADDAVSGAKLADGSVSATHITGNAVGTAHLQDAAVNALKLAGGAVSAEKLNLLMHAIY